MARQQDLTDVGERVDALVAAAGATRDYLKAELAKLEIEASLRKLDPRTLFNIFFFKTNVSSWKSSMILIASSASRA